MKKFAGFLSVGVLAFTVVGCSDSTSPAAPSSLSAGNTISGSDEAKGGRAALPTLAGAAVANPNFSTLVYALQKAGLVETFSGNQQFTVFAPTNAAFDAAAAALGAPSGIALIDSLDVETLTAILKYHVALGDRRAQAVLSSGQVRMMDGNWAAITVDNEGAKIDGALITATDIVVSNGVIHVLAFVMLPPSIG